MSEHLNITVNGEARIARAGSTIADLLVSLGLTAGKVAVERNRTIVPRSAHGNVAVQDGDQLEIVHFVGGG